LLLSIERLLPLVVQFAVWCGECNTVL